MERIGARFGWIEPRRRALAYLCGLLALLFSNTVYETGSTPDLLPLTVPELSRLLWRMVGARPPAPEHVLAWLVWAASPSTMRPPLSLASAGASL
jgi:hypothetical protein